MNSVPKFKVQDGVVADKLLMDHQDQIKELYPKPFKQYYNYTEKRKMDPLGASGEKENEVKIYKSVRLDDKFKKQALTAIAEQDQVSKSDNLKSHGGEKPLEKIKELKELVGVLGAEINKFYWKDRSDRIEREYLKLDSKLSIYFQQLNEIKVPEKQIMKPTKEKINLLQVFKQLQNKLYFKSNVPVHFLGNYYK